MNTLRRTSAKGYMGMVERCSSDFLPMPGAEKHLHDALLLMASLHTDIICISFRSELLHAAMQAREYAASKGGMFGNPTTEANTVVTSEELRGRFRHRRAVVVARQRRPLLSKARYAAAGHDQRDAGAPVQTLRAVAIGCDAFDQAQYLAAAGEDDPLSVTMSRLNAMTKNNKYERALLLIVRAGFCTSRREITPLLQEAGNELVQARADEVVLLQREAVFLRNVEREPSADCNVVNNIPQVRLIRRTNRSLVFHCEPVGALSFVPRDKSKFRNRRKQDDAEWRERLEKMRIASLTAEDQAQSGVARSLSGLPSVVPFSGRAQESARGEGASGRDGAGSARSGRVSFRGAPLPSPWHDDSPLRSSRRMVARPSSHAVAASRSVLLSQQEDIKGSIVVPVGYYVLHGKAVGNGTSVTVTNNSLVGTGVCRPPGSFFKLSSLAPNVFYHVSMSATDQGGILLDPGAGPTCPPVCTLLPLPLTLLWGYLSPSKHPSYVFRPFSVVRHSCCGTTSCDSRNSRQYRACIEVRKRLLGREVEARSVSALAWKG